MTKIISSETKKPKPQRIVLPPVPVDMSAAHSDIRNYRMPTTYKPNFAPNVRSTYTAPVTTFHPKATMQTQSKARVSDVSTYHPIVRKQSTAATSQDFAEPPKTTVQTALSRTSLFDANKFSSHYSAGSKPFTATSATVVMRPNVKDLLATIGLQPESSTLPDASTTSAVPPTTITRRMSTILMRKSKPSTTTTTAPPPTTTTPIATTTQKPELTPELEDLLKSFGLLTNEQPPANFNAGPYQDEFKPIAPSSLRDDTFHVNEFKPLPASLAPKQTPEIRSGDFSSFKPLPIPDDAPSPTDSDLEELLKSYGLLEVERSRNSKSLAATKRYKEDAISSSATDRSAKIPKMLNVPEINVEFLSPELMQVLGDMGVKSDKKKTKTTTTTSTTTTISSTTAKPKTTQSPPFAFEATAASVTTQNDYEKLHMLLDTIKQLDNLNANLTEDELDSLNLRHFNFSDELLVQGPDPLDDYYNSYDVRKNEIKRRQSNVNDEDADETTTEYSEPLKVTLNLSEIANTTSTLPAEKRNDDDDDDAGTTPPTTDTPTTTSETSTDENEEGEISTTASSSTTTTEESRNGSLKDLADSFGGDGGLDPVSDEALPAPKRNGFYFFSDWNSFLEVGEDPDKVVVRFDPKVGDSRPFIPVKIP